MESIIYNVFGKEETILVEKKFFNKLDKDFCKHYLEQLRLRNFTSKRVLVVIDGIVDQTKKLYPMLEISNSSVSYYSPYHGKHGANIFITGKEINATIYSEV